ncbi:MAG TPA: selenocysteine-specific translation elongation factor [Actinomycetota bacterium]|nr:selenocysteine-specific translation elongation factor [Actinomycetota bacterium]
MRVVSTAGHVDHGKSTLIERLSGIDPDRLAEEKARGLTIDLGFAWLTTPEGHELGIVDVPGHERFIHNMLAGVGSVDATIFVVAANEGWKPQSEEHLAILDLLGARNAVVALTKADLVDKVTLQGRTHQISKRLTGTSLAGSEVVAVSAAAGTGIDKLLAAIDRMLARAGEPLDTGRPRVFLDRSFSVKGAGTVVTGTLTGGSLRTDDAVVVLPAGHATRIRGIQTHKQVRDSARPVSRVALNLSGLERAQLARGDALVVPGQWQPTTQLDVKLRVVRALDHALSNKSVFKAYIGSAEVEARLAFYDARDVPAGGEAFARLSLQEPVVAGPLDRIIVRDVARGTTVAGGTILDAHPPTLRGPARESRAEQLRARATASPEEIAGLCVLERGVVPRADLIWMAGTDAAPTGTVSLRTIEVAPKTYEELTAAIVKAITEHHEHHPLVRGMPVADVRDAIGLVNARLFTELLESMSLLVVAEGSLLRLASHAVTLSLEEETARDVLLEQINGSGFSPPSLTSLIDQHGDALVRALMDSGVLVKIGDNFILSATQLERAKQLIAEGAAREGPLTAARIKELLETSRKFAIPLLEYLDAAGFTRRRGDLRELVG